MIFNHILEDSGLEAIYVVCNVGCTYKSALGLKPEEKSHMDVYESMCNQVAQAKNSEKTFFNVMLRLNHLAALYSG